MKCKIVRDLLPSYIDGLTSQESNQAVEEHLSWCEECREYFEAMREETNPKEAVLLDTKVLEAQIRPFKKLRRVVFGILAAVCILGILLESLQIYYTTGVTPSSQDVNVTYEKTGNMVSVEIVPKKDNIYIEAGVCNEEEGTYVGAEDGMGDTLLLIKYRKSPFGNDYKVLGQANSFQYNFVDENTVKKRDGSGEVELDGSETIKIQFSDMECELRIKDLYTKKGIAELEKKLGQ